MPPQPQQRRRRAASKVQQEDATNAAPPYVSPHGGEGRGDDASMTSSNSSRVLAASARGATWIFATIASQRLVTFALNFALLRLVTADQLGYARDMELMLATIHFVSREMCRLVALRSPLNLFDAAVSPTTRQQYINLAWLPVPLGLSLCCLAAAWHSTHAPSQERSATLLFCFAAAVEVAAEPLYIISQSLLLYGARARTEISANVVKCVLTFVAVAALDAGATSFAVGQLAYATVLLLGYALHLWQFLRQQQGAGTGPALVSAVAPLLPGLPEEGAAKAADPAFRGRSAGVRRGQSIAAKAAPPTPWWSLPYAALSRAVGAPNAQLFGAFAAQGAVKHLLTEGDSLVLLYVATRGERGMYAVVTNYGSLVARMLFAPLEETARSALAKLTVGRDDAADTGAVVRAPRLGIKLSRSGKSEESAAPVAGDRGSRSPKQAAPRARGSRSPARRGRSSEGKGLVSARSPRQHIQQLQQQGSTLSAVGSSAPSSITRSAAGREGLADARAVYFAVLRIVSTIALVCSSLGAPFAPAFVPLLLGRRWAETEVPAGLSAYAVYLSFLAVNGITEAFVTATAEAAFLVRYNLVMTAACAASLLAAAGLVPAYGLAGLVAANCVGMAFRIAAGLRYIALFTVPPQTLGAAAAPSGLGWRDAVPSRASLLAAFLVLCAAVAAEMLLLQPSRLPSPLSPSQLLLGHCASAGVLATVLLGTLWLRDGRDIRRIGAMLRR